MLKAFIGKVDEAMATFTVHAEKEDISPKASMAGCSKEEIDNFVAAVKGQQKKSRTWGWCCVRVTAKYGSYEGNAYLGCCSYTSKEDFIENSGYYKQLCDDALSLLNSDVVVRFKSIENLITVKDVEA